MFNEILAIDPKSDKKGTDNMTAIIVYFNHDPIKAKKGIYG